MKRFLLPIIALFLVTSAVAQSTPPTATAVLNEAIKEAKSQKKKVFVLFHASWCGWCHKMDNTMNSPEMKPLFDKSFVIKHLTVMESKGKEQLENPGAADLLKQYKLDSVGIPIWFIFDTDGKLLVDSQIRPEGAGLETKGKGIIGCPASKEEAEAFIRALKLTTKLNEDELKKIFLAFRKNDPEYKGE